LKSLLHERFMYLYYTMVVMSLTTLLDKKSPLFSELCLQSEEMAQAISFFAFLGIYAAFSLCWLPQIKLIKLYVTIGIN